MSEDRPARPSALIESPCTKVCKIAPGSRLCLGCMRSIDEIAAWTRMSPADRRAVMQALPARRASVDRAD
jgi:predicted Fe-S protein YdhL (DUF1289 family)